MNSKRKQPRQNFCARPSLNLTDKLFHRQLWTNGCDQRERCFLKARIGLCKSLYKKDIVGHYGCVNAVEFSSLSDQLFVSGGDDRRVLLWKTGSLLQNNQPSVPHMMKLNHDSNIFCLAFSHDDKMIFSAGNDHQVILHDTETGDGIDVYMLDNAIHGVSVHPESNNIFCTACEDGQVQVFDVRAPRTDDPLRLVSNRASFQSVMYNPIEGRLIITSNARDGVQLWDVRRPERHVMHYGGLQCTQSAMSARWNGTGDLILVLRRRMMPIIHHIKDSKPVAYFDHPGYYNSCTSKSCTFGGINDGYVMSGSDNFAVYVWKIPEFSLNSNQPAKLVQSASLELKGHRSIVNQVRYSKVYDVIASSGVEKIIKLWSPWPIAYNGTSIESGDEEVEERVLFSREDYFNMVLRSGQFRLQNEIDDQSTTEDQRMIAFFDTLVQQEIDGSESNSDDDIGFAWRGAMRNNSFQYSNEVVDSESSSSSLSSNSDHNIAMVLPRFNTNRLKLLLEPYAGYPVDRSQNSSEEIEIDPSSSGVINNNSILLSVDRTADNEIQQDSEQVSLVDRENSSRQSQFRQSSSDDQPSASTSSTVQTSNNNNQRRNVTQLIIKKRKENELLKMRQARRNGFFNNSDGHCLSSSDHALSSMQVRRRVLLAKKKSQLRTRLAQIRRRALLSSSSSESYSSDEENEPKIKNGPLTLNELPEGSSSVDTESLLVKQINGDGSGVECASTSTSDHPLNPDHAENNLENNGNNLFKNSRGKNRKYRRRFSSSDSSS